MQELIYGDVFFVIDEEGLDYTYRLRPAKNFGTSFTDELFKRKRKNIVITDPLDACQSLKNAHELVGNIALIERGDCSFLTKVIAVEAAGAIGAIVTDLSKDMTNDYYIEMIHDESKREANIPAGYLLGSNGRMIINRLQKLGLDQAPITIPVNMTRLPSDNLNSPPWAIS